MVVSHALALPYVLCRHSGMTIYRVRPNACEKVAEIRFRGQVGINVDTEEIYIASGGAICSLRSLSTKETERGFPLPTYVWPNAIVATNPPEVWYSSLSQEVYCVAYPYTEEKAMGRGIVLKSLPISATKNNQVLCPITWPQTSVAVIKPGRIEWDVSCVMTACNVAGSVPCIVRVFSRRDGEKRVLYGEIGTGEVKIGSVYVEGGKTTSELYASVEGEQAVVIVPLLMDCGNVVSLVCLFRKTERGKGQMTWAGIVPGMAEHAFIEPPFVLVGVQGDSYLPDTDVHVFSDDGYLHTVRFSRNGEVATHNFLLAGHIGREVFVQGKWLLPITNEETGSVDILQVLDGKAARELMKATRTELPYTVHMDFAE